MDGWTMTDGKWDGWKTERTESGTDGNEKDRKLDGQKVELMENWTTKQWDGK